MRSVKWLLYVLCTIVIVFKIQTIQFNDKNIKNKQNKKLCRVKIHLTNNINIIL